MNALTVRVLRPRGRHAASGSDPFMAGGDSFTGPHPVTREAVAADRNARHALTAQADQPTTVIPALQEQRTSPRNPHAAAEVAADLAGLPAFREAVTRRTRSRAAECICGQPHDGETWAERIVYAGLHLTGQESLS